MGSERGTGSLAVVTVSAKKEAHLVDLLYIGSSKPMIASQNIHNPDVNSYPLMIKNDRGSHHYVTADKGTQHLPR